MVGGEVGGGDGAGFFGGFDAEASGTGEAVELAGYAVPVVDTTGAGDTFHAAYLAAMLGGAPLAERLRLANATAAMSVTRLGPRGWLPTPAEVAAFLEENQPND